jgi:diguanylate cyclase (GGDEF)-like protein
MKRILSLLVPEAPILIGVALLLTVDGLRPAANALADVYPYAVLAAALLLGWRFKRSRLVFAVALLVLAEYVVMDGVVTPRQRLFFHATTLLLPINLTLIALLPERGTFTLAGIVRWVMLGIQVIGVAFLARAFPDQATALLKTRLLPAVLSNWTPVAQPALFAFLGSGALLLAAWLGEPTSPVRGYLFALVAACAGLSSTPAGLGPAMWFATAGLVLVVAVVEASYLMAYRDGLTELPGRRALNEALLRLSGQFTVAMIDVDHFKLFNDRWGHDAGDHVLRMVAARLAAVEGGGKAYRYGGEEFAVLFPGKGSEECLPPLEQLRETIETSRFTLRRRFRPRKKPTTPKGRKTREQVVITVSIGVAEKNHRHSSPDQVVMAADKALYRAKEGGRNRVSS